MADNKEWKSLGDGSLLTQDPDIGLGHIVPIATYNKVFASLVLLTTLTVLAAYQPVGAHAHLFIALAIAAFKAGLVTLIFMHLKFEGKIIWVIVCYPMFIFMLLLVGTLGDVSMKGSPKPARFLAQSLISEPPAQAPHGETPH
jgi:caa(3)-type oxidase subunit IV